MLTTDNWCIKVGQRVYGPYTSEQLAKFATEGRLTPQSLISPAGGKNWRAARQFSDLSTIFENQSPQSRAFGKNTSLVDEKSGRANFVIIFDPHSGAASRLEDVVRALGAAFRLTGNVWCITSEQTVLGVKNALAPHLMIREPIMVIDCKNGKTAWHNFQPDVQSRLTQAWTAE